MRFSEVYGREEFGLTFEVFPPKTAAGEETLFEHVAELVRMRPKLITCTYGAGGSTRNKTLDIVSRIRRDFRVSVAAHLTCVGSTLEELRDYLADAQRMGIDNIVALRGDPPRGETSFRPVPGGLRYANELVAVIRSEFPGFGVAVAGYPEKHLEAASPDVDLENLKRKVDAGADVVITQLFYDNADFYAFRDRCERVGIRVPIVPGLLPVTNFAQIQRITSLCGAKLPAEFVDALARCGEDEPAQFEIGVRQATEQAADLIAHGVPGIHFYVLNKSQAAVRVIEQLPLP
jgi:methylenetetrahydrofolate reductase (NADPH)